MLELPFHIVPSLVLGGGSASSLWALYRHLFEPRCVSWYAWAGMLVMLSWILTTLFYRVALHPLAKYPCPLAAALTDWYTVYWLAERSRHLEMDKQHRKHGKYFRFGPSRLSINSPHASRDLHHIKSNTFKSQAYGSFKKFFGADMSLTTVDHHTHKMRRRVNTTAITPAAVRGFGPQVTPHVDYFIQLMKEGAGTPADGEQGWTEGKDMSYAIAYCIADIMGSVTFGKTWDVQRTDTYRKNVKALPQGVAGLHLVGHMQSLFFCNMHTLLFRELINGVGQLMGVARSFALWRLDQGDKIKGDICDALINCKDPETGLPYTKEEVISEATLFIIGGTDTMITSTTGTLFYLLHNPHTLERLTKEIRDAFPIPPGSTKASSCPIGYSTPELQAIKYLTACIDEAMRISPAIPGVLPRRVGKGGIMVDGEYFPEGVDLAIPHYSLHRTEEFFPEPLLYAPERWLPEERKGGPYDRNDPPAAAKEGNATSKSGVGHAPSFTPFGIGRTSCIGKYMAYQEMSYILARLLWTFDLRLEPNNTLGEGTGNGLGRERAGEFQLYDCFVSSQQGPVVQFRFREELNG